jgi:hypothetical protein
MITPSLLSEGRSLFALSFLGWTGGCSSLGWRSFGLVSVWLINCNSLFGGVIFLASEKLVGGSAKSAVIIRDPLIEAIQNSPRMGRGIGRKYAALYVLGLFLHRA